MKTNNGILELKELILDSLSKDKWFKPRKPKRLEDFYTYRDNKTKRPKSYYHKDDKCHIYIRVSEHSISLNNCIMYDKNPEDSLLNLSIVFFDNYQQPKLRINKAFFKDKNGESAFDYKYFVVEEYAYNLGSEKFKGIEQFNTIITTIKSLSDKLVYSDPLKKLHITKVKILIPLDSEGNPILPNSNYIINKRQLIVAENKDKIERNEVEVDAQCNVINLKQLNCCKDYSSFNIKSVNESQEDDESCENIPSSLDDYEEFGDFVDGIAWAYDGDSYGYIDKKGVVVIPFGFEYAENFSNGLAYVMENAAYASYIDTDGNYIFDIYPSNKDWIISTGGLFNCERTWIEEYTDNGNSKIHIIDTKGRFVTPSIYDDTEQSSFDDNGLLEIEYNNLIGVIDIYGFICDDELN